MAEPADQLPGGGLAGLLGISPAELQDGRATARLEVREELSGPGGGALASGVYAGVAEAICIQATRAAIDRGAGTVETLTTQTSLLAQARTGEVEAVATARHRGRTTWVWDVEFRDGDAGLCAATRLTVAIRAGGRYQPR